LTSGFSAEPNTECYPSGFNKAIYPDVLVEALTVGSLGNYCTSSLPCSEGFGDCDSDSECKSGLTCGQRSSYADALAGLTGFESAIADYCYNPSVQTIT
jgi:hypothetical protein